MVTAMLSDPRDQTYGPMVPPRRTFYRSAVVRSPFLAGGLTTDQNLSPNRLCASRTRLQVTGLTRELALNLQAHLTIPPSMSALATRDPREPGPTPAPRWDALMARLAPCLLILALCLAVIPASGGYFPRTCYPAALASLLLFCAMCAARRRPMPAQRITRLALGLFAALVA